MTEVEKRSVAEINQGMTFEPSTASQPDRAALLLRLDELLETYLNTLDQYQKAQQQLATRLSSGYFSLAQANFNNQSRTRYGQDYYDERMQALRKM
jgi:type II secretory pathway pseudopilin PulG